jgi:hypothetical protein
MQKRGARYYECPKHAVFKTEFYCSNKECEHLFCSLCMEEHKDHDVSHLFDIGKKIQAQYMIKNENLKKNIQFYYEKRGEVSRVLDIIKKHFDNQADEYKDLKIRLEEVINGELVELDRKKKQMMSEFLDLQKNLTNDERRCTDKANQTKTLINELESHMEQKHLFKIYEKMQRFSKDDSEFNTSKYKSISSEISILKQKLALLEEEQIIEEVKSQFNKFTNFLHDFRKDYKRISQASLIHSFQPDSPDLLLYDIKQEQLELLHLNLPSLLPHSFDSISTVNSLFLTGGTLLTPKKPPVFLNSCFKYDLSQKDNQDYTLETMANMLKEKGAHTMARIGEELLYTVGGEDLDGPICECERYSVAEDSWTQMPALNEKKYGVSVCAIDNSVLYCFGGQDNTCFFMSIEKLHKLALNWELITCAWNPRVHAGVIQVGSCDIMIFGGRTSGEELAGDVLYFNTSSLTMKTMDFGLRKNECFYQSKPTFVGGEVFALGYNDFDIHVFNKEQKEWRVILEKEFNPMESFSNSDEETDEDL